uniref:Beta-1,4-N-acetylgalactosaminyltransferase n=1 Tax=Dermatophagoides pteronyssinus TaxID=6956 RepID=A0A6P6YIH2_DERPT|nr:beta-1,4-galactosyltransferase 4-like [Dermatophagoides pteronyssinus]
MNCWIILILVWIEFRFRVESVEMIPYYNVFIPTNSSQTFQRCQIDIPVSSTELNYEPKLDLQTIRNESFHESIEFGGRYRPHGCQSLQNVAIIVPYRNRSVQLQIFIYNIHKFLSKQNKVQYQLFIVEQKDMNQFNRAKLLNVGFNEAIRWNNFDCFIFHDVELLPLDLRNLYLCSDQPRHMSSNIVRFAYFYEQLFGGVCAISTSIMNNVNGFSNRFFGWGGEDDEMRSRLVRKKYQIQRFPSEIARYIKLSHPKDNLNDPNPQRFRLIKESYRTSEKDGLNNLDYILHSIVEHSFYVIISVEFKQNKN